MAAKKASDAAVLSVQEEITQALGDDMPKGNPTDQKFLKQVIALFGDKSIVSDADWNDLSNATADWVTAAADALKDKEALPPMPGAEEDSEEAEGEEVDKKDLKKTKKAAKKVDNVIEVEVEETEQEEESGAVASDESTSEDLDSDETETQGKESEVATKNKRGTKAVKSAKAKDAKPQKRAAAPEAKSDKKAAGAGKAKANGHARVANGIDTVTELAWRNPKASLESVIEKAKAAGVKTSETQIGTLYHIAHKNIDIAAKLGKIEA